MGSKGDDCGRSSKVVQCVEELLLSLGVDLKEENFLETPRRVATYLLEHFLPSEDVDAGLEGLRRAVFPSNYEGMVVSSPIVSYGICPHHLLPILYTISLAYIPKGHVIGASKLTRVCNLCMALPILQESLTVLLAGTLIRVLETPDVAVVVEGRHLCMVVRGVKQPDCSLSTSIVRGAFEEKEVRNEFLMLTRRSCE